jgi:anti-anti-sigma regulatory factor
MDDLPTLKRQLALDEALLNVLDALRPDLPTDELYELALQVLSDAGSYQAGSLWIHDHVNYQGATSFGMDFTRAGLIQKTVLSPAEFHSLLSHSQADMEAHWWRWPRVPAPPSVFQTHGPTGHTLILPLVFTDQIGFVALEGCTPQPDQAILATLTRFANKIAVALDTARVFQERLRTIDELQRLTQEQHELRATVLELSTPLLPLLSGVLVLPLIGAIDAVRAERTLQAELQAIIHERAQVVLVDITGTSVVDTNVAIQLIRAADAARLLGCDTILVGVQPEIAQTLVGLGIDLRGITTRSTLAEGLQAALRKVGFLLVRGSSGHQN